jgi:glutamine amidotransferase
VITVVDYDAGNLRSVVRALEHLGHRVHVSDDPYAVARAEALVLPGVGAAGDAMRALAARGLVDALRDYVRSGRPMLGVCVGLQLLFETSDEDGSTACLGLLPGRVRRLPAGLKVPHIGWNRVRQTRAHPIFDGIPDGAYFYFVHSYAPAEVDPALVLGETEYGAIFPSVVGSGRLVATQFHPEKSGENGLRLYDNFVRLALAVRA